MALRLFVLTASEGEPPSVLIKGRTAKIGRSIGSDVRLPDPSVSPHHATIRKRGESYILVDEGSTHGTSASSPDAIEEGQAAVLLAPESPRILKDGEHIWVGEIELVVAFEATQRGAPTGQEELPYQLVRLGLRSAGLTPTDTLVTKTLAELTDLPEERLEPEIEADVERERLRASVPGEDESNPPWITDLVISGLAVLLLGGCAYGIYYLIGLR